MNFLEEINLNDDVECLNESYKLLTEKSIVKMDKNTLKKRLMTQATLLAAKEANSPDYAKYIKVSKAKRFYRKNIQKKFGAKGKQKYAQFIKAHRALSKKK